MRVLRPVNLWLKRGLHALASLAFQAAVSLGKRVKAKPTVYLVELYVNAFIIIYIHLRFGELFDFKVKTSQVLENGRL